MSMVEYSTSIPGGEAITEWWLAVAAVTKREKRTTDIESMSHAK